MSVRMLDVPSWELADRYASWFSETPPNHICVLSPSAVAAVGEVGGTPIDLDGEGIASFLARELVVCSGETDRSWLGFAFDEMSTDPDDEDSLGWKLEGAGLTISRQVPKLDWRDVESTAGHPSIWTIEDAWEFWNGKPQGTSGTSRHPWHSIQWSPLRDDLSRIVAAGEQHANRALTRAECLQDMVLSLANEAMLPGPHLLELEKLKAGFNESQAAALSQGLEQLFR